MAEVKYPPKEQIDKMVALTPEEAKEFIADPANQDMISKPIDELETLLVYKAARVGNLELVRMILEKYPKQAIQKKESNGADILQHSVVSGNLDLVKFILTKGADPKVRYFLDVHILYFAMKYKHHHILKYFVEEHKMDPNEILGANGIQGIYMAMEQEDKELFKYLLSFKPQIENIGPHNYLAFAARLDDTYYLEELLNINAPFEIMEPYDRSAFSWAGEDNKHPQMEMLLKRAKGIHPEALLAPGISQVSHEYNSICDKWWRLYDIYQMRYFTELQRKEVEPKGEMKAFIEEPNSNKVFDIVTKTKGKIPNILFKVPRNIFRGVMKYLDALKVDIKVPEP